MWSQYRLRRGCTCRSCDETSFLSFSSLAFSQQEKATPDSSVLDSFSGEGLSDKPSRAGSEFGLATISKNA